MRCTYVLFSVLALATAAIHPTGPVYRSAASVVNSSPVGKSLPQPQQPQQQQSMQQQFMPQEHSAEERAADTLSATPAVGQPNTAVSAQPAPATNPQNFKVVFYPNVPQQQQVPYNQGQYPYQPSNGPDLWTRFRMNDVVVAGVSIVMFMAGTAIWYPRLANVKARALRELSEMKSEDASRMAKSVLHAIERIYEMNKAE